ncbi:MAG: hypothetical protein R3B70_37335 [Polyangiaceae bacterium]
MTWHVAWHPRALHRFYELPWKVAERLDAAVLKMAEGDLRGAMRLPDSRLLLVRVQGASALVSADRGTALLFVVGVVPWK